ncbi:MAG: DUF4252 domain-containing protein [Bacteroidales bacterium]|nr:DUF4252 domain-containing protein [Candidatus Hennigimonas equi]
MKKTILILASIALFTTGLFAGNPRDIYRKYAEKDDVDAVFISSAMFRLIGALPEVKSAGEDLDFTPLMKSLTGMYILDSHNESANGGLRKDVESLVGSGGFELLMEANDGGEKVRMYTSGSDETIDKFIMFVTENNSSGCTFIALEGKMKREDIEKVVAKSIK